MPEDRLKQQLDAYGQWLEDRTGLELRAGHGSSRGPTGPRTGSRPFTTVDTGAGSNGDHPSAVQQSADEDPIDRDVHEQTLVELGLDGDGRRRRMWVRTAAAIAAAGLLIAGVVGLARNRDGTSTVVASGGDTSTTVVRGFGPSVLPDAIVQEGPEVSVDEAAALALEDLWRYADRDADWRALFGDAGFVDGRAATFTQNLPFGTPSGGHTAALRFEDDQGAVAGFRVVNDYYRNPEAGLTFGSNQSRLLLKEELDVALGDESSAFVMELENNISDVTVVLWRNDNVVHIVWAKHLQDPADGPGSVIRLAEEVDALVSG